MLMVVEPRASGDQRQSEQQVCQRVAGDERDDRRRSVGQSEGDLRRKSEQAARLHVAEGVLLRVLEVESEFEQLSAASVGRRVEDLKVVSGAVLRVVVFVAEGRKAGDADEAQAEIARVVRQLRQSDLSIDADAGIF